MLLIVREWDWHVLTTEVCRKIIKPKMGRRRKWWSSLHCITTNFVVYTGHGYDVEVGEFFVTNFVTPWHEGCTLDNVCWLYLSWHLWRYGGWLYLCQYVRNKEQAVPVLRLLYASLSPWRPGLNSRPVRAGIVAGKLAVGTDFSLGTLGVVGRVA